MGSHLRTQHGLTRPSPASSKKFKADSKKQKHLEHLMVLVAVANAYPFDSFFESASMLRFVRALEPLFSVPCAKTAKDRVMDYASQLRIDISKQLKESQAISLTTDMWSKHGRSFMGLTAKVLTKDAKVEFYSLGLLEFSGDHSAASLESGFNEILARFDANFSGATLTTDNASNMRAFAKRVGLQYVPCFAHLLQLVVRAGLDRVKEVKALVKKANCLALFLRQYTRARIALREAQKNANRQERMIPLRNDTRWSSTYLMLHAILQEQEIIQQILDHDIHVKIIVSTRVVRSDDAEESAFEDIAPFGDYGEATNEGNAPVTAAAEVNHAADDVTGPVSGILPKGKTGQVDEEDAVPARLSNKDVKLSAKEWDSLTDLVNFLQEFAFLTDTYQGNDMHISDVVVAVSALMSMFDDKRTDSSLIQDIKTAMKDKAMDMMVPFCSKTDPKGTILDPNGNFWLCFALDPRFAHDTERTPQATVASINMMLQASQPRVGHTEEAQGAEPVRSVQDAALTSPPRIGATPSPSRPSKTSPRQGALAPRLAADAFEQDAGPPAKRKYEGSKLATLLNQAHKQTPSVVCTNEYDMFLHSLKHTTEAEKADPIAWWVKMKTTLPTLAPVAIKLLMTQPTEVPSERLFSAAGRTFSKFRTRLSGELLGDLLLVHDNAPVLKEDRRDKK
jgi:hypothetical protein